MSAWPRRRIASACVESSNSAGGDDRSCKSRRVHRALDRRDQRNAAPKRPSLIGKDRRHTFVAALAGVRIHSLAHFRLLRIFKLPAFRERQKIKTGSRKLNSEIDRISQFDCRPQSLRRRGNERRPVIVADRFCALREKLPTADARDFRARRRSRHRDRSAHSEIRPSYRHARNAVRRHQNRLHARGRRRRQKFRATPCGSSRTCGRCISVTCSR